MPSNSTKLHSGTILTGMKSLVLVAVLLFAGVLQAAEPAVISFGVVPQQNASKLAKIWRPILRHLSEVNTTLPT